MTHSLYYLPLGTVARIVNTSSKRKLSALVHRHKETFGHLNCGEQQYSISESGVVTQVNVATGEKYHHPSLEALFHQGSAKTSEGGLTWTIRKAGGDSYIIDFVACPNEICDTYVPLQFLKPETSEVYEYKAIRVRKFLSWTWITAETETGRKTLMDLDLFTRLRRYVAGKQRTPRLKTELNNHARRLCNKEDIISVHGGGASDIPVATMTDYVEVAFYVDQRNEFQTAVAFAKDNLNVTTALNSYYESGRLPKDFSLATRAVGTTTKTFTDAAIKVIDTIRAENSFTASDYLTRGLPTGENDELLLLTDPDYGGISGPWY